MTATITHQPTGRRERPGDAAEPLRRYEGDEPHAGDAGVADDGARTPPHGDPLLSHAHGYPKKTSAVS